MNAKSITALLVLLTAARSHAAPTLDPCQSATGKGCNVTCKITGGMEHANVVFTNPDFTVTHTFDPSNWMTPLELHSDATGLTGRVVYVNMIKGYYTNYPEWALEAHIINEKQDTDPSLFDPTMVYACTGAVDQHQTLDLTYSMTTTQRFRLKVECALDGYTPPDSH